MQNLPYFQRSVIGAAPVLVLANDRFAMGIAATLYTLCLHLRKDVQLEIIVGSMGLSAAHQVRLKETVEVQGRLADFTVIAMDQQPGFKKLESVMDSLSIHHRVARCWFAKIAALEAAAQAGLPWCFFLDGDVLVNRDMSELLKPSDFPLKAVEDKGTIAWSRRGELPDFLAAGLSADAPFFNSGVMMVDLDWWRQTGVFQKCLDWVPRLQSWFAGNHSGWQFSDQNVLNVVYHNQWEVLPGHWNVQGTLGEGLLGAIGRGDQGVFHFCTNPKPWDRPLDEHSAPFFHFLDETPYHGWRPPWWLRMKLGASQLKCRIAQWQEKLKNGI